MNYHVNPLFYLGESIISVMRIEGLGVLRLGRASPHAYGGYIMLGQSHARGFCI